MNKSSIFNYFNSLGQVIELLRAPEIPAGEMALFSQWSIGSF